MKRKGELSSAQMDRNWPYQIAVPEHVTAGANIWAVHQLCKELEACPRRHAVVREGVWYNVFCFAKPDQAEAFKQRYGGEPFDTKKRNRGGRWHIWEKT